MAERDEVVHWIKRALNQLRAVTVVLALAVLVVGAYTAYTSDQNHDALCDLRADLDRRVQSSEEFLEHPEQFPAFNDPETLALIRQQVQGQKSTIAALGSLNC